MDRLQILLLGFPLFLLCSDVVNLFTPRPTPPKPLQPQLHRHQSPPQSLHQTSDFSAVQSSQSPGVGYGTVVELKFCVSCSYKGNAVTMKKMLEASFPGIDVILSNYPPPLPKRLLSKVVPVVQFGMIGLIMGGEQIFPRLGMAPPPWFFSLRANRFGTMATTWLLGNFAQSFLQSSGAFEVYCNGDLDRQIRETWEEGMIGAAKCCRIITLSSTIANFDALLKDFQSNYPLVNWPELELLQFQVFSKLKEQRFPSEFELRQLIGNRLPEPAFGKNLERVWS